MASKDSLGDRMKENYEARFKFKLLRRTPVIIRVDGKAFHSFTRGFNKPFDRVLSNAMDRTMKALCENIQGCVFGYVQSDEITLVLNDYSKLTSCAWFDNEVQKMCSVSASMTTSYFNRAFADEVAKFKDLKDLVSRLLKNPSVDVDSILKAEYYIDDYTKAVKLYEAYSNKLHTAMFDSRCFNIPVEEVTNCVLWRQQDATRNSIEMVGRHYFSNSELYGKNTSNIQDMLMENHGVNWNDFPVRYKRGCSCFKRETDNGRTEWFVDYDMPIISKDRDYIEKFILPNNN